MTRVIVAAHNRSLSLGLAGQDYDVVDLRPDQLDGWLHDADGADVLVVGVDDPVDALELAHQADNRRPGLPVLLVAGSNAGWSSLTDVEGLHASLLPLPVTRPSLVAAVERLIQPSVPEPVAPEQAAPVAEAKAEPRGHTDPGHRMVAARSTDALRERLSRRPRQVAPEPTAVLEAPPAPALVEPRVDAPLEELFAAPAESLAEPAAAAPPPPPPPPAPPAPRAPAPPPVRQEPPPVAAAPAAPVAPPPSRPAAAPARSRAATGTDVRQLVDGLLGCIHRLYDVRDAALAVVEEGAARTSATCGVVMLPDGDVWRVCGAIGVRPLEWRYIVEPDSWLVTTVINGDRGVIVEDSDIARQRLGGAPLAHHKQLMAAPIPGPHGLVLVARETAPFSEAELTELAALAADAGPLLSEALLVRELARALSDFRAVDD